MIPRRTVLAALALLPTAVRAQAAALRPEDFGAKGDGRTDDTLAFQAAGRLLSERGGGTLVLRRGATYRVGRQARGDGKTAAYLAQPMLRITHVDGLVIQGNGATLRLNDGLHYGSFDPATGRRFDPPRGKFTDPRYAATVGALIELRDARDVRISDVVLDGNMRGLIVGGRWNVDIQLHADGLQLIDVSGVVIERVHARDNGLDGIYLRGRARTAGAAPDAIALREVRCTGNGRQGVSVVGGAGIRFTACTFADTGQGKVSSAPGAGVDIEPNGRDMAADLAFDRCTFVNNRGVGLLAAEGASHAIAARDCTFWQGFDPRAGATHGSGDAFWLTKPGVRIERCRVHGTVTNLHPTAQVRASAFDDAVHPRLGRSGRRRPYLVASAAGTFSDCTVTVGGPARGMVYATTGLTLRRCVLRYAGSGLSPRRPVAFFGAGVTLENVTFAEAPTVQGALFIHAGRPVLKGRVTVTGPHVRWGGPTGRTGNVAVSAPAGSAPRP